VRVPAGIALAVLGGDARGRTIGAAEHDRAAHLAARHVQRLGRRIDDLVDRLLAKLKVMNSTIGFETAERRTDRQTREAMLGDRRVDDAPGSELVEQAPG